jgi:molybdopterin synthase sulfur carrier subunit
MRVKFFATFRDITQCKEESVQATGDVWELLQSLCDRYLGFRAKLIDPGGTEVHAEAIVLVNGRDISHLDGKGTLLREEDVVSLFPVVAGG